MDSPTQRSMAQKFKDQGNKAFKNGNFKLAIDHYTSAIKADPSDHVLPCNRAFARLKLQQWKSAERDCTCSLELLPHPNCKALFRRGTARKHLGNWTDAQQDLKAALALEPNNTSIRTELDDLESHLQTMCDRTPQPNQTNLTSLKPSSPSHTRSPISPKDSDSETSDLDCSSTRPSSIGIGMGGRSSDEPIQLLREISTTRTSTSDVRSSSQKGTQSSFGDLKELRQKKEDKLSGLNGPHGFKAPISSIAPELGLMKTRAFKKSPSLCSTPSSNVDMAPVRTFVEFEMRWGASNQSEARCLVLEALDPRHLTSIFGEHLEPEILEQIIGAMEVMLKTNQKDKITKAAKLIQALDNVSRISTLSMFLEPNHLQVIQTIVDKFKSFEPNSSIRLKNWTQ